MFGGSIAGYGAPTRNAYHRGAVKRAADHLTRLQQSLAVRTIYVDLDGTLLGPGGSLFASPDGVVDEPAAAVASVTEAGVDLVLVSGRTRAQVREVARAVSARAYIAELGGVLVYREDRDEIVVRDERVMRGRQTAHEAIHRSGAAGFLLERYRGRLEPRTPWANAPRESSVMLRGLVDVEEATAALAGAGYGWLGLQDNGIIPSPPGRFPDLLVEEVRAYHLVPAGVSKRSAVALDRARRGLPIEGCIAIGDSSSDAAIAPEVGAVFIVANGGPAVVGTVVEANVYLMDRSHGLGFADAVLPFLPALPGVVSPA